MQNVDLHVIKKQKQKTPQPNMQVEEISDEQLRTGHLLCFFSLLSLFFFIYLSYFIA